MEGFQIRRRECKEEPCVGERVQERKCEPIISENCKGLLCSTPFCLQPVPGSRSKKWVGDERGLGEKRKGRLPALSIRPLTKSLEEAPCMIRSENVIRGFPQVGESKIVKDQGILF